MEFVGLFRGMIEGIHMGCFDVVAHPDRAYRRRIHFGAEEREVALQFLETISDNVDIVLEKNYSSMKHKNHYKPEFWELAPPETKIIFGTDAHSVGEMEQAWNHRPSESADAG